jgi:hypothetical protein
MNLSKYGFPYLGDGSEKWRSYPHIVPKNLDAIALFSHGIFGYVQFKSCIIRASRI